jgi:hypothetical protein
LAAQVALGASFFASAADRLSGSIGVRSAGNRGANPARGAIEKRREIAKNSANVAARISGGFSSLGWLTFH